MKTLLVFLIPFITMIALLVGLELAQQPEAASAEAGTVHTVLAGGNVPGQSAVRYFPADLQVHRGDTVTWEFYGPHNVHFTAATRPTGQYAANVESGAVFQSDANSGVKSISADPAAPTTFSLIFDAEEGVYSYLCDIHPGMKGTVEVVADDVELATLEAAE